MRGAKRCNPHTAAATTDPRGAGTTCSQCNIARTQELPFLSLADAAGADCSTNVTAPACRRLRSYTKQLYLERIFGASLSQL